MGFLDFLQQLLASLNQARQPNVAKDAPKTEVGPATPVPAEPAPSPTTAGPNPDRFGTFIIPDVYPQDLGSNPPFHVLPGLIVQDKEAIGCYVKCSEGVGWGAANEEWFRRAWAETKRVGMATGSTRQRYGIDWFRGAYHFLRFQVDGVRQADYFCDLIESAGGWGEGDLMSWVDVEEGGQGTWANDPKTGAPRKLEEIKDPAERKRLAGEITKCVSAFVTRIKQRYPGMRVGVYGRGVFRDLGMTSCRFGADAVCNPAYTDRMPPMDGYGWPLEDVVEWQLCGDGEVYAKGFPAALPGWGKTDYSVVVYGTHRVGMADVRRRCLARPR